MLIFVTGGARSGKSRFSLEMANRLAKKVVFVATCLPNDAELKRRIQRHRSERPKHWRTIENPANLTTMLSHLPRGAELVLIDCLTLYVSAHLMQGDSEVKIAAHLKKFCQAAAAFRIPVILVSNEVGMGVVPASELGRQFRDYAGRANQIAARYADQAYWMVSGLPVRIKGEYNGG